MVIFNFTASRTPYFLHTLIQCKILVSAIKTNARIKYSTYDKESRTVLQNGPWKVLFFGTDEFAVESLKTLYNKYESKVLQRLEVVIVKRNNDTAVAKYAKQKGINMYTWPLKTVTDFHIGIVVSFGHLIPSNIINSFPLGMLNVHGSVLPRWRGAAPIIYSLMNGDHQTGITIMKIMPKKFDVGEIVLQRQVDISKDDTLPELYTRLAKLGATLLAETFDNLLQFLESATPQDNTNATYAPKITSKIATIKWDEMSAKNVYDLHRALLGLYPLSTMYHNQKLKLHHIENIDKLENKMPGEKPGTVIYDKRRNSLIVTCKGESYVSVKKLVIHGKLMTARDFHNGFLAGRNKRKVSFT